MVLCVPRGEEAHTLCLCLAVEVGDLGQAGRWRLFEQAMESGGDAFASDVEAWAWRSRNCDRVEPVHGADHLAPVSERPGDALARPARRSDELEATIGLYGGHMLVSRNLAVTDDADPDRLHDFSPAT